MNIYDFQLFVIEFPAPYPENEQTMSGYLFKSTHVQSTLLICFQNALF